jgi:hypothetical protein
MQETCEIQLLEKNKEVRKLKAQIKDLEKKEVMK